MRIHARTHIRAYSNLRVIYGYRTPPCLSKPATTQFLKKGNIVLVLLTDYMVVHGDQKGECCICYIFSLFSAVHNGSQPGKKC